MKGKADNQLYIHRGKGTLIEWSPKVRLQEQNYVFFPKQHNVFEFVASSLTPVFEETGSLTVS